jgi:hypothetical protein
MEAAGAAPPAASWLRNSSPPDGSNARRRVVPALAVAVRSSAMTTEAASGIVASYAVAHIVGFFGPFPLA